MFCIVWIFYSDIITFTLQLERKLFALGNDLGKCIYSKVLKTQDLIFFLRYGRVPNVGRRVPLVLFWKEGSSPGLLKQFLRLLVISSYLDVHTPTFRLCFFFCVLGCVCVYVCLYGEGCVCMCVCVCVCVCH